MAKEIFNKVYGAESLCDLSRDIHESFDERFNPVMAEIPVDEHYFQEGSFVVTVTWFADDEKVEE